MIAVDVEEFVRDEGTVLVFSGHTVIDNSEVIFAVDQRPGHELRGRVENDVPTIAWVEQWQVLG